MKNGVRNGKKTRFSRAHQPSGEAKSQGWARRRLAQEFMDKVMEYQDLTIDQFEKLELRMQDHKSEFTIRDLMAFKYVSQSHKTDKFLLDWLDRHVSKAPRVEEDVADNFIDRMILGRG